MAPTLLRRSCADFEALSPLDTRVLLARAGELLVSQRSPAERPGAHQNLLRGKHIGLLCSPAHAHDGLLFTRAATALGAEVAPLRVSLAALGTPAQVQRMARVLGRLYDAVECLGLAPELVRCIGVESGVPVFEGLASGQHPTLRLASALGLQPGTDAARCVMIQTVLLSVLE